MTHPGAGSTKAAGLPATSVLVNALLDGRNRQIAIVKHEECLTPQLLPALTVGRAILDLVQFKRVRVGKTTGSGAFMLGTIILVAIQFATALLAAPLLLRYVPVGGDLTKFAYAVAYAVIIWVVGLVGSFALKDVNLPSSRTLGAALVGGLIGAALLLVPGLMAASPIKFPPLYLPLIGAIIGYMVQR